MNIPDDIKNDILDIPVSDDFDILTAKGRRRKYRDISITLGQKKFGKVWHYWWHAKVNDEDYGFVYLAENKHPELKEICFYAAGKSIDKLLGVVIDEGGKKQ